MLIKRLVRNFPWQIFLTGVILILLSFYFKAYDLVAVSCFPIVGSFGLCIYSCVYEYKTDREIADHIAERQARFEAEMEEYEREDRERYGIV